MKKIQAILLTLPLRRKLKEFKKAGYEKVTIDELKKYCEAYLWKKKKAKTFLEKRQAIDEIKINAFFDYQQLRIQTTQKPLSEMDDYSDLF